MQNNYTFFTFFVYTLHRKFSFTKTRDVHVISHNNNRAKFLNPEEVNHLVDW